jgi:hypothetical protein
MTWTREQLDEFNRLRKEERAEAYRDSEEWRTADVGYRSTSVTYSIEYQHADTADWFVAAPFFEPLSLHPETTGDEQLAHTMAVAIREGTHPTHRGRDPQQERPVTGTRVIERTYGVRILAVTM